jgi:arginine decarboxylase
VRVPPHFRSDALPLSGHHHRRGLPLGERLGPRHPRAWPRPSRPRAWRCWASPATATCPPSPSSRAAPRPSSCRSTTRSSANEEEETIAELRAFVEEIRFPQRRHPDLPARRDAHQRHIPNDILRELHGFIHMFEDTPEFIARYIVREAKAYLDSLPPPFFRALTHYAADGSYSWHCPGHSGGVAFLKSPVGQMFHQFFGENMLRADVCNAVEELGQLLDHTGPVAASERNAARIFNADHLFFVTNGTSTSNKIVWHSTVAPGDIVVVDRNCHKSILHAIIMTGAIPVFLMPTRNNYGIIGPIPKVEFSWKNIQKKIAAHPLRREVKGKPRVLTITQSTYDGILYNVEEIKEMLDGKIDTLHFDEAWLPHAAFHDFYGDYHAIGADRPRCKESMVFSTQSTHKLLAGLSQASQILVQDSRTASSTATCSTRPT